MTQKNADFETCSHHRPDWSTIYTDHIQSLMTETSKEIKD
jgi:hypothetical protein